MASSSRVTHIIRGFRTRWRRAGHEIRRRLTWNRLYRVTSYARSALWIVPFLHPRGPDQRADYPGA